MTKFQPMLAATIVDVKTLSFPLMLSPKLDGIRAIVKDGVLLSRKLKPIPSIVLQERYGNLAYEGMDGELICGLPNAPDAFRRTTSAVMTIQGDLSEVDQVSFHVFDDWNKPHDMPYFERLKQLELSKQFVPRAAFMVVPHVLIHNLTELDEQEKMLVGLGFEGVMLRDPDGPYKFGRSTLKEEWLMKLKRFSDGEYLVEGFEEKMHNENEAETDERGYTKRTSHQENKVGMNTLGAWIARGLTHPHEGVRFRVAPTGTHASQKAIWDAREDYLGTVRKYKFFPSGSKDAPRFPTDLGPRKD